MRNIPAGYHNSNSEIVSGLQNLFKRLREQDASHTDSLWAAFGAERIESLEAENAALREAQRWIPVTERLPDTDACVAVLEGEARVHEIDRYKFDGGDDWHFAIPAYPITHWMPLPTPPEEQK